MHQYFSLQIHLYMSLTDTKATSMTGSDCLNSCFNTADKIINNLHENFTSKNIQNLGKK